MHGDHRPPRSGTPLRPRAALQLLGALGCGLVLGRVVDILDYTGPLLYGAASWAAACRLTVLMRWVKPETDTSELDILA